MTVAEAAMKNKILFAILIMGALHMTNSTANAANPLVRMTTSAGVIDIEVFPGQAPQTAANFLAYVDAGFYDGTIFHRVIPGFVIQGGGFTPGMKQKPTRAPIQNEADNGLKNLTGTLSMARTGDPHSATSQFFINLADNAFLDYQAKNQQGWGYAVFAKVVKGMDAVNAIAKVKTGSNGPYRDVPVEDVVVEKVERL